MSGLLHAPFSLIVYASPVLSMESFTYLREIAWDTLLDADQDLSVAAGTNRSFSSFYVLTVSSPLAAFFLLSCSKDRGVNKFFQEKTKESHNNNSAKKQIIERYLSIALHDTSTCRHGLQVHSVMEDTWSSMASYGGVRTDTLHGRVGGRLFY